MKPEYDFSQGQRGAITSTSLRQTRITIQIDDDILEWFHSQVHAAGEGNYQTLISNVLYKHVQYHKELSEMEEKTTKELAALFEFLANKIERKRARTPKLSTIPNIKAKWERISFIGVEVGVGASSIAFAVSSILLRHFNTVLFAWVVIGFLVIFVLLSTLLLGLIFTRIWKSSKGLTPQNIKLAG